MFWNWHFEKLGLEEITEIVDLDERFPTSIWLQKSASTQKRTNPSKFGSQITLPITCRDSCRHSHLPSCDVHGKSDRGRFKGGEGRESSRELERAREGDIRISAEAIRQAVAEMMMALLDYEIFHHFIVSVIATIDGDDDE